MKKFFFILLVASLPFFCAAQSSFLKQAAAKLDKALIAKDTMVLKQLLHKSVTYGHSNGWVETKAQILNNLAAGKMAYNKINSKDEKWIVSNNVATRRNTSEISYVKDDTPGDLILHVVQVWMKTNKGWQLLTRQSTKL